MIVAWPFPLGSVFTIGMYMSLGGRPFESVHDCGITWYWPFPSDWRSWLIRLFPGGIWFTMFPDGCDAPDLTDRQPPITSWPAGSWSDSSGLMFEGVPLLVFPEQLPPVRLSVVGRSIVPYAPGWLSLKSVVPDPLAYTSSLTAYGETWPLTAASASSLATAVAETGIDDLPNTLRKNVGATRDTVTVTVSVPSNVTDT